MGKIRHFIVSVYKIYAYILFGSKPDVIFYYPQHFNRSDKGTNPYFDPMLDICKERGIRYLLLEEPDASTPQPRNKDSVPADFLFWTILAVRKAARMVSGSDYIKQERVTARIINILTFGKLRVKKFVTISGSMEHLFSAINKKGEVYDLQHGIIYTTHWGYFDEGGNILETHHVRNLNFLVFGSGFYDLFFINENNNHILKNRVSIIGDPLSCDRIASDSGSSLLYSLQFTCGETDANRRELTRLFDTSLTEISGCGDDILYKHHPRFNNAFDLSGITGKYGDIFETSEKINTLKDKIKLHITFSSTTCFEYAAYGIPTYFLYSDIIPQGKSIFYGEYKYPLYKDMTLKEVTERLKDPVKASEDAKTVKEWYDKFYSPFDKEAFYKIIKS